MDNLTDIDRELIVLVAACDLIDDMVNYTMVAEGWQPTWSNILFATAAHAELFNIRLSDFLSAPQPSRATNQSMPFGLPPAKSQGPESDGTFLFYLKLVTDAPKIRTENKGLKTVVKSFSNWLDEKAVVENAWFPSIETEVTLSVTRCKYLKICGNIAKHNFTRLAVDANKIKTIMKSHKVDLGEMEEFVVLEEFQAWFHDHAFLYQSSHIAEQLNTIRWEIYEYIKDVPINGMRFSNHPFINNKKHQLKRLAERKPPVPRFNVDQSFKSQCI